ISCGRRTQPKPCARFMLLLLRFGLLFHDALPCGWPLTRSKGWCRADERGLNRLWRGPQQITGGHWIPAFMASVLAPAAWRYSPPSALDRALAIVNCPAKLFDEGLSRRQIRKTPAIKRLAFLQNYMAVSQLDMSRIVKVHDPTA